MTNHELVIAGVHHKMLESHLLPADGKEAAAILFCRSALPVRARLMVIDQLLIPHRSCSTRLPDYITWPGELLSNAIDRAEEEQLSLILVHSHPGGYPDFSRTDDESDQFSIGNIFAGWSGPPPPAGHGSAIMTGTGRLRARLYDPDLQAMDIVRTSVFGDDIRIWEKDVADEPPMAFSAEMTARLGRLHACVIGVSGTGSIIAEQAARMGFGGLTLIDFDRVEPKNLNRIVNSSAEDAANSVLKVEMFEKSVMRHRPNILLTTVAQNVLSREAVLEAAKADIIFSCVDSAQGRQVADLIASAFMIPLIDMGVTIPTRKMPDGSPAIAEVMGRIDYVQPFGSTLGQRQVYTPASLRAEYLAEVDVEAFDAERREGYIKGTIEQAPSVIALNMRAASSAMLELVARIFPFRHDPNRSKARSLFALADGEEEYFSEDEFEPGPTADVGRGPLEPLLGLPALGKP